MIIDAERWISDLEAQLDEEGCPWEIQEYNLMFINEIQARWDCIDEELENKGKLLKLPCAVGDTVYAYCNEFGVLEYTVDCIVIDKNITFQCSSYLEPIGDCPSECLDEIEPDILDFGKTVFLTREEAEAALKNM